MKARMTINEQGTPVLTITAETALEKQMLGWAAEAGSSASVEFARLETYGREGPRAWVSFSLYEPVPTQEAS